MNNESHIFSFSDLNIYYQTWTPENYSKIAIIVHGIAEHSGRHRQTAETLTKTGFKVYCFDNIGHGKSSGRRGHIKSFTQYTSLLASFIEYVFNNEKNKITLIGHSMGSLIILTFLQNSCCHTFFLNNVILSAPALEIKQKFRTVLKIFAQIASTILPNFPLSDNIKDEDLVRDKSEIIKRKNDPLINRKSTLSLFNQMFIHMELTKKSKLHIKIPTMVLIAGKDKIVDSNITKSFFKQNKNISVVIYENSFHELFNDLDKNQANKDIIEFLHNN